MALVERVRRYRRSTAGLETGVNENVFLNKNFIYKCNKKRNKELFKTISFLDTFISSYGTGRLAAFALFFKFHMHANAEAVLKMLKIFILNIS